jgi:ABC-2 type transport system permease protein
LEATVSEVESAAVATRHEAAAGGALSGAPESGAERHLPARVVSARVSLRARLRELWRSRELLAFLVRKELKVKYKNSALGFAWSMLNPALVLLVYYIVFTVFLPNGIPHFALFLFSGLLAWNLFNTGLMGAAGAIVNNASIVKKVAFPREILALAQVGTACVFFLFQGVVLIAFFAGFRYQPDWAYLPLIPLALAAIIVLTSAFAIFLSAVNVYLRDTQHLIEVLLTAWFWGGPVVYAFALVYDKLNKHTLFGIPGTHLIWLYLFDPIAPVILAFQRALYGQVSPTVTTIVNHVKTTTTVHVLHGFSYLWYVEILSVVLVVSVLLFFAAMMMFGRIEGNFAEEL